jgi:hypothetical protein
MQHVVLSAQACPVIKVARCLGLIVVLERNGDFFATSSVMAMGSLVSFEHATSATENSKARQVLFIKVLLQFGEGSIAESYRKKTAL